MRGLVVRQEPHPRERQGENPVQHATVGVREADEDAGYAGEGLFVCLGAAGGFEDEVLGAPAHEAQSAAVLFQLVQGVPRMLEKLRERDFLGDTAHALRAAKLLTTSKVGAIVSP